MDINSVNRHMPVHTDEITPVTPAGSIHPVQSLNATGVEIRDRLDHYFQAHRPTSRSPGTQEQHEARNAELDAIRDDRAFKLQEEGFTIARMEKAEKNAAKLDTLVLTNIKAGMAGAPFAGMTLLGNLHPEVLEYNPQETPLQEIGKQNTFASLYASGTNLFLNRLMKDLKPTENLNPKDADVHSSLKASRVEKREFHDKGLFHKAVDEANKWGVAFIIRNFVLIYGPHIALEATGHAKLATAIENLLRPLTALAAGIAIEHFNQQRDKRRNVAGPAMLYGLRDYVPEGQDPKPISEDHEWLDNLKNLEKADWLFSSGTSKELNNRVGKGIAGAMRALASGDAIKDVVGDPANLLGEALLAGGFALYGVGPNAIRNALPSLALSNRAALAAIADGVKEFLGAGAFWAEAFGGVVGKGLSEKAVEGIDKDDQVAKGVTKGLDTVAHASAVGARKTGHGLAATGNGIVSGGQYVGTGIMEGGRWAGQALSSGYDKTAGAGRSLRNRAHEFMSSPSATQGPAPAQAATTASTPAIPMTTLQAQPSSSNPQPTAQPAGSDDMV